MMSYKILRIIYNILTSIMAAIFLYSFIDGTIYSDPACLEKPNWFFVLSTISMLWMVGHPLLIWILDQDGSEFQITTFDRIITFFGISILLIMNWMSNPYFITRKIIARQEAIIENKQYMLKHRL